MTPEEALAAIDRVRAAAADLIGETDESTIATILAQMAEDLAALEGIDPGDEPDEAWAEVGAAFDELQAWLAEPVDGSKAKLTREQRINIAVRIATRGRGAARTRDFGDAILDTFYGGLGAALRGTGRALAFTARMAGRAAMAAGEAVGRGVHAGAVHVDAYIRNGRPVRAYDRDAPGKSVGAHLLYR